MQSADYVPGVSGWKMDKGLLEVNGGPCGPVRIGVLEDPEVRPSEGRLAACCLTKQDVAEPFIVVDGVTYINQAIFNQGFVDPGRFKVNLTVNERGQHVVAGIGLGVGEFEHARAKGAGAVLDYVAQAIEGTALDSSLRDQIDRSNSDLREAIREVIRNEIRPGGMLCRN